jgi:hypothetical protein
MKAEADKTQEAVKWTHHRKSFEFYLLPFILSEFLFFFADCQDFLFLVQLLCKVYRLEYSFASKVCSKMIFFLK